MERTPQVLVAEGRQADLQLLCNILRQEGFQVSGCTSAAEALDTLSKHDCGVAVIDLRLAGLEESGLLKHIRDCDGRLGVIVYAGGDTGQPDAGAIDLSGFAVVESLDDPSELLKHVHRAYLSRINRYAFDLEQAVAARTAQLAQTNDELQNFASVVAHDLRSPLLTISGYCQLLQEEYGSQFDGGAGEYLAQILRGAERMSRLIDDLLEYSRAARAPLPRQKVDMESVVVLARANLDASIREQGATIVVGPMPEVMGDPTQLTQLMQNLIGNALTFRREEPPHIRIAAKRDGSGWRFSVEDNGIGIPREHFDHIFQAFHRLHGHEYPGTGIGLALCKRIVERHGGHISLMSTVGKGSTFFFTIPD